MIDHKVSIHPKVAPEDWPDYYRHAVENLHAGVTQFVIHPGFAESERDRTTLVCWIT